ncbi:hypothetical protein [Asticcacaulis sp. 201]|uniref:hypothetical protein n=1 Tax=Asticcacaulis sp. 201 TaxID=3028787 RepID=UPI002916B338|nr:hypothetical protein [Asticcacaulis sp. 201]MDV6329607.1 hypothetical protein [Asticcacaulis sp. 201]
MLSATLLDTATPSQVRDNGREHVIFETIVALLALMLIITGFTLYVSQSFAHETHIGSARIVDQAHEPAYSLAEM